MGIDRTVNRLADGSVVYFGHGTFDEWAVFVDRPHLSIYLPLDSQYFTSLRNLSYKFSSYRLYRDFLRVYDVVTREVTPDAIAVIRDVASSYWNDGQGMELLFTILYAAMVAEENKEHAPLGKRIKRLGVHQVLVEGWEPEKAANWSRGQSAIQLMKECAIRGF